MSRTRVAIVGGGITGLAAAVWLEHDHGSRDVIVLEADDRPGGKIRSSIERGHVLERAGLEAPVLAALRATGDQCLRVGRYLVT